MSESRSEDPGRLRMIPASLRGLSALEQALIALVALAALASQLWHPFSLGFFHDDWSLFVYPKLGPTGGYDLRWALQTHADRPGYALLNYGLLQIWNGTPWLFHLYKVVLNLAAAALISLTALRTQELFEAPSPPIAACAAAFSLLAPWGAGYTIWPTAAFTNVTVIATCLSALGLMAWWRSGRWLFLAASVLAFAASVFTYQSGWAAVFPFLIALALSRPFTGANLKRLLVAGGALLLIQAGAIALALWKSPKKITPDLVSPVLGFPVRAFNVASEHLGPALTGALAWTALALLALALVVAATRAQDLRRVAAGVLMLVIGLVTVVVLYASASYLVSPRGSMSRTTQYVDFWTGICFALVLARPGRLPWLRFAGLAFAAWMIVVAIYAYVPVARGWREAWIIQRDILTRARGLAACLRAGDAVLQNAPMSHDGIEVFSGPWDITPAILVTYGKTFPTLNADIQVIPPYPWLMSWKPGAFTIGPGWVWPGAKRALIWNAATDRLRILTEEATFPPEGRDALFASATEPPACAEH